MIIDDPQAPDAPINGTEQPTPTPKRELRPFLLFAADLPWPGPGESRFHVDIPQPAFFRRAYRAEKRRVIANRVEPVLRMVWLVAEGGELARADLIVQKLEDAVLLADDGQDPHLLDLAIGPHGEPIALWQLALRPVPAAQPETPASPPDKQ